MRLKPTRKITKAIEIGMIEYRVSSGDMRHMYSGVSDSASNALKNCRKPTPNIKRIPLRSLLMIEIKRPEAKRS